jgi:hypothetical protein
MTEGRKTAIPPKGSAVSCQIVVRAAGERTEAACAALAASEVGPDRVRTIREVPFAAAIRRGFEIGVEAGADWTLCLDADVLLAPGAIAALCAEAEAERLRGERFAYEGLVADKLMGHVRSAGVHLYRTEHLPRALAEAEFNPRRRRPESYVKLRMRKLGLSTARMQAVTGLHDHEQYYRDIFRKVFTHTRKHARFMAFAPAFWRREADADPDLRAAWLSWRLSDAVNELTNFDEMPDTENVAIDIRAFPDDIGAILKPAGLEEKAPLGAGDIAPETVAARLDAFAPAPEYLRERPRLAAITASAGHLGRARAYVAGYGVGGTARALTGRALMAAARRVDPTEG